MSQREGFRFNFFHCKIRGPKFVTTGMLLFKFFSHKNQGDLNFYNNHRWSLIISNQPQTLLGFQIFSPQWASKTSYTFESKTVKSVLSQFFSLGGWSVELAHDPQPHAVSKTPEKGGPTVSTDSAEKRGKQKGREPRKPCIKQVPAFRFECFSVPQGVCPCFASSVAALAGT